MSRWPAPQTGDVRKHYDNLEAVDVLQQGQLRREGPSGAGGPRRPGLLAESDRVGGAGHPRRQGRGGVVFILVYIPLCSEMFNVRSMLVFCEYPSVLAYSNLSLRLPVSGKRESELATFDKNRREVGMLNPMRDKIEGTYRGGEGTTPMTTACPEDR